MRDIAGGHSLQEGTGLMQGWCWVYKRKEVAGVKQQLGKLGRTRSSVAVLAHIPNATVLTSHFIASMTSRMAMVAYGDPPALCA